MSPQKTQNQQSAINGKNIFLKKVGAEAYDFRFYREFAGVLCRADTAGCFGVPRERAAEGKEGSGWFGLFGE